VNQSKEDELPEQDDVFVNTDFTTDKILLFLRESDLSETKMNWLKSLGPKSETETIGLIGMTEQMNS
jgi:hypothetical protein